MSDGLFDDTEHTREHELCNAIIGAAIEVHKVLGPGMLESAYQAALSREFALRGLDFKREVSLPVSYKGVLLDCGYRLDFVVQNKVVVELKAVDKIGTIHIAQLLTYLRLSGKRLGLLLNFNVPKMRDGIRRLVYGLYSGCQLTPSMSGDMWSG